MVVTGHENKQVSVLQSLTEVEDLKARNGEDTPSFSSILNRYMRGFTIVVLQLCPVLRSLQKGRVVNCERVVKQESGGLGRNLLVCWLISSDHGQTVLTESSNRHPNQRVDCALNVGVSATSGYVY